LQPRGARLNHDKKSNCTEAEQLTRIFLQEIGIDKKLSMRGQQLNALGYH
jgi:hypothetical protein